jgi:hypothetical protein
VKRRKMSRIDMFLDIAKREMAEIDYHIFGELNNSVWKALCALVHMRRLVTNPFIYVLFSRKKNTNDYIAMQCFNNPIDRAFGRAVGWFIDWKEGTWGCRYCFAIFDSRMKLKEHQQVHKEGQKRKAGSGFRYQLR